MIYFLLIILIIHGLLLTKLIFYPYPELFIYPYLLNHGLLPYKQILDQHFPGLLFLPINFNNLGMLNEITARYWLIGVTLLIQVLIYFVAKKLFNSKVAILSNILFLIWHPFMEGWVLWIDSFMPLFLLLGFFFANKSKLMLAGIFLGIAVLFKQTAIPLVGMVCLWLILQKRWADFRNLMIGFLPLPVVMVIYYCTKGIFADFWFWTVIFNLTTYAKGGTTFSQTYLIRILGISVPFILALRTKINKTLVLLGIFVAGSLVGAFDRADFVHFQPALPFIVIGVSYLFVSLWNKKYVKILAILYIALIVWWLNIFFQGHVSDHIISFEPQTKQIAQKIKSYTKPNEEIFVFGAQPHLYQMSNTLPSGRVFVFQFPWFIRESEYLILSALKVSPPHLVVRDLTMKTDGQYLKDYAEGIDNYISQNYTVVDRIGDVEFLLKNDKN